MKCAQLQIMCTKLYVAYEKTHFKNEQSNIIIFDVKAVLERKR